MKASPENEFEYCKVKLKESISELINSNKLDEAKSIIKEYEDIVKNDREIYSMNAIVAIMEHRLKDAKDILSKGLEVHKTDFDLLYNMGYIYQLENNLYLSINFYEKALDSAEKIEDKELIVNILKEMNAKGFSHKTSIIILTYNNLDYNKPCIESIRKYTKAGTYEIVVVDNNSTDGTKEWLEEQNDLKVIFNTENVGFPKGCNQGISIADETNDILLLNNDTLVTPNWLDNLTIALHSSNEIGAVGAVTNSCSNYQTIQSDYTDFNGLLEFAEKNNISDPSKWENRLRLVGFCMLIKREVIEKIGLLDELFTPGNFEDDDYSYRMISEGYKLLLCKDSYIYHFGGASFKIEPDKYNNVLDINKIKFKDKWGFDPHYSAFIRYEIIGLIDRPNKEEMIRVLEVGCACGGTLLEIKNQYKNADLFGIELNENSAKIARTFANVKAENIENENLNYAEKYFDYIIFADVLEHLYDPGKVLTNLKKYLKDDGKVLASIPNVMHYSVIRNLINGRWYYEDAGILDRTHIRFFTLTEINNLFIESGYEGMNYSSTTLAETLHDQEYIDTLSMLSTAEPKSQFSAYQYIIRANKKTN